MQMTYDVTESTQIKEELDETLLKNWQKFKELLADSDDNEVLSIEDFPRTKFSRELIIFDEDDTWTMHLIQAQ